MDRRKEAMTANDPERVAGRPPTDPGEPLSDRSLLRHFRNGSGEAATELYRRYAARLRALARTQCSPYLARRLDTEDIVQSVFHTFFQGARRGNYDVPAGEDLWGLLLFMALNKIRAKANFHQAAKRDVRLTAEVDFFDPAHEDHVEHDDGNFVFLQLVVREALDRLPAPARKIVELRIEGHEVADIARQTGRSKRTVERILRESRNHLSTFLEEKA
jgi:RNA polymerase sigma-70 factor (ECF subfamily)